MSQYGCYVRNLRTDSLSGFRNEKDALTAGGCYLRPDTTGWLDVGERAGLCVICENCGSVIEDASDDVELYCPDCGESLFRVFQTFRLIKIKDGFYVRWHVQGLMVAIELPNDARAGMLGIYYTIDGSDPSLTSLVYTGPIQYHKEYAPIRVAVYYSDARSQIIEWDYGRAETNRNRIRKQSVDDGSGESRHTTPKLKIKPPEKTPRPATLPSRSPKEKGKSEKPGCLHILGMGIGGVIIFNAGLEFIGVILIGYAVWTAIRTFGGDD